MIVPSQYASFGHVLPRLALSEDGIDAGSMIALAQHVNSIFGSDAPGVVIMNPNELYFSWKSNDSLTYRSWMDGSRPSLWHPMAAVHDKWNRIPGNESEPEHIKFVFEQVLAKNSIIRPDAKLDIITITDAGETVLSYLNEKCRFSAHLNRVISETNHRRVLMGKQNCFNGSCKQLARFW